MHYQNSVKEFMTTFDQDCPSKPVIPDEKIRLLRVKLLLEEVFELAEASGVTISDQIGNPVAAKLSINPNITPDLGLVADAIADISYVNYGAANAYGIDIEPIEQEVHSSNMTKLWTATEVASETNYSKRLVRPFDARAFLVKNADGKVIKSPSYTPANIEKHIVSQINN